MRIFLVLICSLALASVALGKEEEKKPPPKKKPAQAAHHAVAPAGHPVAGVSKVGGLKRTTEVVKHREGAGHPSQHAITPAGNARLQTQHNVSTAPLRGAPRGQANAQRFQARRFNLANKPNPAIASVKFRANNQIQGSQNWQGQHYQAFRAYRSQWHDRDWWGHRYSRVGLFGGGWYYWNSGFWYPAWGYDPGNSYYPYDGPIYGYNDLPPDQVIGNVQAALQQQGYYHGEVDGLLGPLTRAAIADYQRDRGLYITSAIDQPTLESLGMA